MQREAYSIFPDDQIAEFSAIAGISAFVKALATLLVGLSILQLLVLLFGYRPIQICTQSGDVCTTNRIMWINFFLIAYLLATLWMNLKAEQLLALVRLNRSRRSHTEILQMFEAILAAKFRLLEAEHQTNSIKLASIEAIRKEVLSWMSEGYYKQFPGGTIGAASEGEIVNLMYYKRIFALATLTRNLAFNFIPKLLGVAALLLTVFIGGRLLIIA